MYANHMQALRLQLAYTPFLISLVSFFYCAMSFAFVVSYDLFSDLAEYRLAADEWRCVWRSTKHRTFENCVHIYIYSYARTSPRSESGDIINVSHAFREVGRKLSYKAFLLPKVILCKPHLTSD